jgi:hypothetical protein
MCRIEFVIRLGNRIALHHRCKPPHRCNPGEDSLAEELHVSVRKVLRGIAALKALGWIAGKRGGSTDKVNITLCIPQAAEADVEQHPVAENDDLIPDNILSPMDASSYLTETASIPDTQAVTSKEQRNREVSKSAASRRAPAPVDIVGPVTDEQRARAFGALIRAYPKYPPDCSDSQCREIFDQLIDDGTDPADIIDGAKTYADRCNGTDSIRLLIYYLRVKGWQPENYHHMQPMHVLQTYRQPPPGFIAKSSSNFGTDFSSRMTLASS